jgi:signal transduction histidine kinase
VYDGQAPQAATKQQQIALIIGYQPLWVEGDPLQLEEALNNLIHNAIKYTPDEGSITVSISRYEELVTFRVRDTGYGIPESQQERLFQPFFRVRTQETKAIEGTGLGLHLVKNIVTRHNGHMFFQSVRGEGSTFGFDLPLRDAPTSKPRATGTTVIA